ncbi:unnamed protein product [Withania somnifera]
MRIRKHAKISPLQYASSAFLEQHGAVLQPHVCQLNQSPWDVITFPIEDNDNNHELFPLPPPPPPSASYMLDGYDSCAVNGTFYDSEQSITSMKNLDDNREMNFVVDVPADFKKDEPDDGDNNIRTMCCKNDGKRWQCSREAKRGHNLCEHHFAQVKKHYSNNNDSAQYSTIISTTAVSFDTLIKQTVADAAAETTPSSRFRPHRPKKSSSSDFYYYSGFGPLWGKKRSASTGKNNNAASAAAAEIYSSHDSTTHGAQSSSSQMDNEGFEYVEDEDDDEVENCKMIKRARKPIKARSLKSLM